MKAELIPAPRPPEPEPIVRIEMSRDEAITLKAICNKIDGDSETTYREHTSRLSSVLRNLGIDAPVGSRFKATEYGFTALPK